MFLGESRKGRTIPTLHYAISKLRKLQDFVEHIPYCRAVMPCTLLRPSPLFSGENTV